MLDAGEKQIVRMGGRSKSPRVEPYQLRELSRRQTHDRVNSSLLRQADAKLYKMHEEMEEQILILKQPVRWDSPLGGIRTVLDDSYSEFSQFLRIPALMDGFTLVGRGNQKVSEDFLFEIWRKGENAPDWLDTCMPDSNSPEFRAFWTLDYATRYRLLEEWRKQLLQPIANDLNHITDRFNDLLAEKEAIKRAIDGHILTRARVIGVTTTGAAMYRDILTEKAAGVVIVEEAGEVLEAHVLSSLSEIGRAHV